VLPTLSRTFQLIQKKNSAAEENIWSPSNFPFLKEFGEKNLAAYEKIRSPSNFPFLK
jgi:hypothetical protein